MKKCFCIFFLVVALMITALVSLIIEDNSKSKDLTTEVEGFTCVCNSGDGIKVYKHESTGVYYLWKESGPSAGLTIMLNDDGTPYVGS